MLEEQHLLWRCLDKPRHHILVGQEVASPYRIPGMEIQAIALLGTQDGGGASLGAHGVGTHELHLGDDSHVGIATACDFHSGTQSSQPGAHHQDVMTSGQHSATSVA